MRKIILPLVLALAAPVALTPIAPSPAEAKFKLEISIDGVGLHTMRRWRADDPLTRPQLVRRTRTLRKFLGFPFLKKKDRRHAAALINAYEARLAAPALPMDERAARRLLAMPRDLSAMPLPRLRMLRSRIIDLLASPEIHRQTRNRLAALRADVSAEIRARSAPPPLPRAERQARDLLARRHDLRAMPLPRLQRLGRRVLDLLASRGLYPATRRDLTRLRDRIQAEARRRTNPPVSRDEQRARALLARAGDVRALRGAALRELKFDIIDLLASPDLRRGTRQRLARLLGDVRAELRRRNAPPPVSASERRARRLLASATNLASMRRGALRGLKSDIIDLLASPDLRRGTRQRLARLLGDVRAELRRRNAPPPVSASEAQARRLLARARDLSRMSTPRLRENWSEAVELLSTPGIAPATRRKLARLRARLAAEINARRSSAQARRILQDTRPATRLSDAQLRTRLAAIRQALRIPGLPERYSRPLRRMLARDRAELRRRVAIAENGRAEAEAALAGTDALIQDHRPSRALRTQALRRRIRALRKALTLRGLSAWRRGVLARKLREDRAELRARLLRARAERRARLARERRFQLDTGIAESPSISAAEAGRRAIERQLAAAPRQRLGRRFTLRELRARPGLRDFMPAIDLDSIHFGFNEYWVREEEIGKLERIGEAIERIIAAHPGEVFLIEGHTDAVGSADYNQRLSEKRALAVKQALTEYFNIPADNLVTIGYGERFLKIPVPDAEPENRRVSIRRITPLLER